MSKQIPLISVKPVLDVYNGAESNQKQTSYKKADLLLYTKYYYNETHLG